MTDHTAKARELFDAWGWALPQINELAAALREAAAVEREACAKICEVTIEEYRAGRLSTSKWTADVAARTIRARGEVAK